MSTNQNAIAAVFDAQRTAIEQSQRLTHDTVEAQKAAFQAIVDGVDVTQSVAEQNTDLSQRAIHAYLDALEVVLPADADLSEVRTIVDDQIEAVSETQDQSFAALVDAVEESGTAFDELADSYVEVVDNSFDAFLDSHERLEANVEEAADEFDAAS